MPYNKTTKPGTEHETYGDYHKKSYQTYKPGNHQKLYGNKKAFSRANETATEPVNTSVKKELKKNVDRFPGNFSSARPIKTTTELYRG